MNKKEKERYQALLRAYWDVSLAWYNPKRGIHISFWGALATLRTVIEQTQQRTALHIRAQELKEEIGRAYKIEQTTPAIR